MFRVAALCLALLPAAGTAESRFTPEQAALLQAGLVTTADGFVLPSYEALRDDAGTLTSTLERYCSGEADIAGAHAAFADVFLSWQRASVIQVGPVMDAEGPMRVQLWPDPKGFSRRAVRMAVRAEDAALVKPDGLVGRSIALLNLTALEELLYGDLAPGSYACELSLAVARYQADLAADLLDAWTPGATFRTEYDTAASGNDRYGSVDAVIRDLLAGAVVYTDRLRKHRIQRGLGAAAGEARAERTEATSSGLGLASIAENFRTLAELYELPYGFFDITPDVGGTMEYYMLGETAANIADSLALESRTLTEIAEEDGPMAAELRSFGELVLFHEAYFKTGLPSSIGLTTGFTSADGD